MKQQKQSINKYKDGVQKAEETIAKAKAKILGEYHEKQNKT